MNLHDINNFFNLLGWLLMIPQIMCLILNEDKMFKTYNVMGLTSFLISVTAHILQ